MPNPLDSIQTAYTVAADAILLALFNASNTAVLAGTSFEGKSTNDIQDSLQSALKQLEETTVIAFQATFEGYIKDYAEAHLRTALPIPAPDPIMSAIHLYVIKQIDYWKMDPIENFFKPLNGLPATPPYVEDSLRNNAKLVREFRNWLGHGKRGSARSPVDPRLAYKYLTDFLVTARLI